MRLLLDTQAMIWAAAEPSRLPAGLRRALIDPANHVMVSAASAWEVAMKRARGRLRFPPMDAELLSRAGWKPLSISLAHVAAIETLPAYHADPFDRALVAQAQLHRLTIVTGDPAIHQYDVSWVWDRPLVVNAPDSW